MKALVVLSMAAVLGGDTGTVSVQFANSCRPEVQQTFNRAITLLHSFEYHETRKLFAEVAETDPGCAMANWGLAMSLWHPLWAPPTKEELAEGARLLAEASSKRATPREAAYVAALQVFYGGAAPHMERTHAYEAKMGELYANHLDDPEAAVFYALALLASADPRDKAYVRQYKAAALLNWARESQPRHPGVLHYLIHAYDSPALAHLGLEAATTYAEAAPDSAHAQHMPSHIFTRLGLWDRSLASNLDSTRSAADYTIRAHLPGHYDEGLHSIDYLMYAMLQTARDEEAKQLLEQLGDIGKTDTENFKVAYTYAASPARYALERRQWQEAADLALIRRDFPWEDFGWAQSIHHFARGIGAARSGRIDAARLELTAIKDIAKRLPDTTLPYWRDQVKVHADAVSAWILVAGRETDAALARASAAADREDSVDKHPVTPGEVLPARELYADMLFEAERYAESLAQYRTVLQHSPNRLNALLGAANAAESAGDNASAAGFRSMAKEQTRSGNGVRVGLTASW